MKAGELSKLGRREVSEAFPEGYPGGSVWKTEAEADAFLYKKWVEGYMEGYQVFPIQVDWDSDTYCTPDGEMALLHDRPLVVPDEWLEEYHYLLGQKMRQEVFILEPVLQMHSLGVTTW